jgi:hypothetical protein
LTSEIRDGMTVIAVLHAAYLRAQPLPAPASEPPNLRSGEQAV